MREGGTQTDMRGFRTPEWKLMRDLMHPGRAELYNLKEDPDELTNLIDSDSPEAKAAIKELDGEIKKVMEEIGDPLLEKIGK